MPGRLLLPRIDAVARRSFEKTALRDSLLAQRAVHRALRRLGRPALPVWYSPKYRIPVAAFEALSRSEPRRADFVAWYLVDAGLHSVDELRGPPAVEYRDIARVHGTALLEAMNSPEEIARVFAVTPAELEVDEVVDAVRLACGGTLAAAREAIRGGRAVLNLSGGFHHAGPSRAGGYCLFNDVAIAIGALRAEGFTRKIAILDLDAHPPDGTAACLAEDDAVFLGSISGTDWGEFPRAVDETVLTGATDATYLRALEALLDRMPRVDLAFVLAGGDVLAGDHHGGLALTVDGARERDERVAAALGHVASVWVPAGGYHPGAWRVLANTALVLARSPAPHVPAGYEPLDRRFSWVARSLRREDLAGPNDLDFDDIARDLRLAPPRRDRLLDFYTAAGLEFALERYGILDHLRRLGFERFRGEVRADPRGGDHARLFGTLRGREHLLLELVVERRTIAGEQVLYIHWFTLRNPAASFDSTRPRLPGQEVPGLGLAREFTALFARMAERLGLAGVAFTPSHYHTAYAARASMRFVSPERQGRFEAMLRDLGDHPLTEVTRAAAEGRVLRNGEPYAWECEDMVLWLEPHQPSAEDLSRAEHEAANARFTISA
jgi:acetoin utilization deacetylase AcuC-like enzyme